ncbi:MULTISPECIES: c-type cytochrome biogenesis protein CcsB [Tsukamurella]|uniref:C-type cytochrome biogenesis protein CcsB n=1 Tax=Tsukamurella strandjordii TaxID=147577 RepID=A0AA90S764_9ACTN|nr:MULTISPECIES: c-type cytochrome biogenesis protein CcsB [Tsukamurella]MDP0396755.1 c-type cytochrome biogenesis protein CcsB [Tsukamurella strandjordii]GIZ96557.1 c-type cytochrome biogenesis protein CcsB [Tsukamurella sp. TY48]
MGPVIDETMAGYSDVMFTSAAAIYAFAMVLLVIELATSRVDSSAARDRSRELVAAGGAPIATASTPGVVVDDGARRSKSERFGRMGYAVAAVGLVLQLASIVTRGMATGRLPWGNMYEFVSITCAGAVLVGLVMLRSKETRPILVFVLFPVLILMFVAEGALYTDAGPVVPALKSYWLAIHVTIVSIGSGIFLVSGVASLLYLMRRRYERPDGSLDAPDNAYGRLLAALPSSQVLDRVAYGTVIVAFPLFSAGVICGAIWAEAAWGRAWGWDPKETVSFVSWVVYAAYLHARATSVWRKAAPYINIFGFITMMFNLFFINYVVSGLHSYA